MAGRKSGRHFFLSARTMTSMSPTRMHARTSQVLFERFVLFHFNLTDIIDHVDHDGAVGWLIRRRSGSCCVLS